jgi:hypothetical protein
MPSKITQHLLIAGAALVAAAPSARAGAVAGAEPVQAAEPEPVDGQTMPPPCRQYLTVPALVEVERWDGPVPPVRAFDPPAVAERS